MDTRNDGLGPASQRYMAAPPSSTNTNAGPSETTLSSGVRPVLNYSIQTGEEFSLEFMRERVVPRKPSIPNTPGDQNLATTGYMDLRGVLGVSCTESESGSSVSMHATVDKGQFKEMDRKNLSEFENKGQYASTRSAPRISSGDGSSRGPSHGYSSASEITSRRMKFLCSFGGKILPRPSDGKLRYVGGDTRIIRLSKDITWQELMQKTTTIYHQSHTIKYQLPGEDLDALVSVSCDEDLQNMIEECSVLEGTEGSQKLRIFLFPSTDFDDMHFSLGSMEGDSEIQYVVAVNGMDPGAGKASSGQGIPSTSASDLDQLLNLNIEAERVNTSRVATESVGIHTLNMPSNNQASTVSTLQASYSSEYNTPLYSYQDHRMPYMEREYYPYSAIRPPESFHNVDSRISVPYSVPSDYNYTSQYAPVGGSFVPMPQPQLASLRHTATEGQYGVTRMYDPEAQVMDAKLPVDSVPQRKSESDSIPPVVNEFTAPLQQHTGLVSNHVQVEASNYSGKHLEPVLGTTHVDAVDTGYSSDFKEDDHFTSVGAFTSGYSENEDMTDLNYTDTPTRPSRVFHSERIPREQAELLNRLSKSDDSIASQFLLLQSRSGIAQESIAEAVDPLNEGNIVSQPEKSSVAAKPSYFSPATVEDGLMQFEKYKELASAISETKHEHKPVSGRTESATSQHQPLRGKEPLIGGNRFDPPEGIINLAPRATYVPTETSTDEQSSNTGRKFQKSDILVGDRNPVVEERIRQVSDASSHAEKILKIGEKGIVRGNVTETPPDGTNVIELPFTSAGTASATKNQENPSSVLPNIRWEDVKRGDLSLPTAERKDILIDINDRFPRDLLSDLFSKARLAEDSRSAIPLQRDNTGVSLNMQNLEPKRWSFFRNLAQGEFARKDVSLMDQDHIDYSLLKIVEEGVSTPYQFDHLAEGVKLSHMDSQIDFDEDMQQAPGTVETNADILPPGYTPSQVTDPHLADKNGEVLRVENPYPKVGENLRTEVPEYEELKFEIPEAGGPIFDTSTGSDRSHLQIIKNEDLEELRELGSGTFGTVYHGKWRGTDVAIKRIKKSCFTGRSSEQERLTNEFWREAEILSQLHHPNVVAFYGVVQDGPGATLATVTEFMVNGSLRHVLQRKDRFDRRKRLIIAMDAAFGMEYLHSKNIVHFDLKCDNLLVNLKDQSRPICKVGDFGLSKIKRNTLVSGGVRGTLPWMAPELLNGSSNKVSEKVDVFSFGIVMWEILTGDEPYANMHYGAIIGGIVNNTLRPPVPPSCDPEWKRLMERCWAPDPVQRPTFTQITSRFRAMSVALQSKLAK